MPWWRDPLNMEYSMRERTKLEANNIDWKFNIHISKVQTNSDMQGKTAISLVLSVTKLLNHLELLS
jgi:hypothetical protein